jgi:hypothetical protein
VPGDPSYPSLTATADALITADPTDVVLTFFSLASVGSAGSVSGNLVAAVPEGATISNVSNQPIAGNVLPSGATVLTGSLSYQVDGLTPGASVDVTLILPPGSAPTAVFKYQAGSYVDVTALATIAGDIITLHLTDGGLGDADGAANGVIVDPVIPAGPGVPSAPPPQISHFSPDAGRAGTVVTIRGTGFTGATGVALHGTTAQSFSVLSDTKITAVVSAGTTTGTITVTGPGGSATSARAFRILPPRPPHLDRFSPDHGPMGTVVTLTGVDFTGVTAVRFHGVGAQSYVVMSDTRITAVVAAGSTTGAVSVTGPGGTATSAKVFRVTRPSHSRANVARLRLAGQRHGATRD